MTTPPAMDPEEFRALGYQAVDLVAGMLATMRSGPVFTPMTPDQRRGLMEEPLPERPHDPEALIAAFDRDIRPFPMGNQHPMFFGWVNSPPAPMGILAEFLAAGLDPSGAGGDHAAIYVERAATRWLMELIGFPTDGSLGIFVSGGSMASLTCLAAARHRAAQADGWNERADGLQTGHPPFVLYVSSEGHTTLKKAAELMGLGTRSVRVVPVDGDFRMDTAALETAIKDDVAAGNRPFAVCASAGTVGTGAVDDFVAIADICQRHDLWFHIDGAYGAPGVLDPAVADQYAGLERADSVALDPHKWLSIPVECGAALVRDPQILRDTFSLIPPYLRTSENLGEGSLPWYSEYGFQQTRGFRALKVWMALQYAGRDGIAAVIQRCNRLARHLQSLVEAAPDLEVLAPANLSICCFRYVPSDPDADLDALNTRIMETVQAEGRAFLTQAAINGTYALRANVLHYATTEDDIAALVDIIRTTGARLSTTTPP